MTDYNYIINNYNITKFTKSKREGGKIVVADIKALQGLETVDFIRKFCDLVFSEVQHFHIHNVF